MSLSKTEVNPKVIPAEPVEKRKRPAMSRLLLLSWGHLVTDMAQGALPALLPVLKQAFVLSYAQTSLLVLVSNVASSVIQPLFGYVADRRPARWLMPAGCLVAGIGLALTGRLPWFALLLAAVAISSLGVAAYHPEGSREANLASGTRKGSGMAVFSVGGNLGFGLGSLFMAWLLTMGGPQATVYFLLPGLLTAGLLTFYWSRVGSGKGALRGIPAGSPVSAPGEAAGKAGRVSGIPVGPPVSTTGSGVSPVGRKQAGAGTTGRKEAGPDGGRAFDPQAYAAAPAVPKGRRGILAAFSLLLVYIIFRSWLHAGLSTYIPLYYTDYLHGDPHVAGYFVSVFLLAGALGTLLGGPLTDVLGAPRVMAGSMALLIPLIYLFQRAGGGFASLALLALIGMSLISTFSTTIVLGQQLMPHNKGLASGFTIGFGVGMGGVGVTLLGVLADHLGVPAVFTVLNLLAIGGLLLALFLACRFPRAAEIRE